MDKVSQLTKDMNKDEVIKIWGEPIEDIGLGLSVYVYRIDSYSLLLSFNSSDKLISAVLQNPDGTTYKKIID